MANVCQQGGMGGDQAHESLPEPAGKEGMEGGFGGQQIPPGIPPGETQQTPPAMFHQAPGGFPANQGPVYNQPSRVGSSPRTLESIISMACLAAFLLLSIVTVALLGAADTKFNVLDDYFLGDVGSFFDNVKNAAFLLSISVITWPFVIFAIVMDGISLARGGSLFQTNILNIFLPVMCCTHTVLSYLLFGAECSVLNELQMFYKEVKSFEFAKMYLGAGILGLFSFILFSVPLPLRVVQTVRNAKLSQKGHSVPS